jgi:molecular chaperone GrpE
VSGQDPERPEAEAPPAEAPTAEAPSGEARALSPEPSAELEAPPPPTVEELERLLAERDELRDRLLRKHAEFDNFRKRVERDRQLDRLEGQAELVRRLVPTLDNLERALAALPDRSSALAEGVALVQRDLVAALGAFGLAVDDPRGRPFDPEQHQALAHEEAPEHAPGTVVEVFARGYRLGDRLLRPALVKVAKGAPAGSGPSPETHSEGN